MTSTVAKIRAEIQELARQGDLLFMAMQYSAAKEQFLRVLKNSLGDKTQDYVDKLPDFSDGYQEWYSKAQSIVKTLLPLRYNDFVLFYEKPKAPRKVLGYSNYVISDFLQGLQRKDFNGDEIVGPTAAFPQFRQQLNILKSTESKLDSALYDIKNLVLGDLLDTELDAASVLLSHKFPRAAGAMAGVVLERHLLQVAENHSVVSRKKNPTIGEISASLKEADVIDVATWRFISHLADVRNGCDHARSVEPTQEQVADLIAGVGKLTKTLI